MFEFQIIQASEHWQEIIMSRANKTNIERFCLFGYQNGDIQEVVQNALIKLGLQKIFD